MIEPGEPQRFFESLPPGFDTATALRWGFMLDGASEDQIGPLMQEVGTLGFTEVEPLADDEREDRYSLCIAEVCVHSAQSFAERVAAVAQLAAREGLVMSDFTAGRADWRPNQGGGAANTFDA